MATATPFTAVYYPAYLPSEHWLKANILVADAIHLIVPADVKPPNPAWFQELTRAIPDAIHRITPEPTDADLLDCDLRLLEAGLSRIGESVKGSPGREDIELVIGKDGTLQSPGSVFLHRSKVSARVLGLLTGSGLLRAGVSPSEDHFVVGEEASNLLLAYVASNVARRLDLDTLTDQDLLYSVQALDALGVSPSNTRQSRALESLLMSAVVSIAIPVEVDLMSARDFAELRRSFSDLRPAMQQLTRTLREQYRADRVESAEHILGALESALDDFRKALERYHRTSYARRIKQWVPWSLAQVLLTAGVFTPEHRLQLAQLVAAFSLGGPGLQLCGIALNVIDRTLNPRNVADDKAKVCQLLSKMDKFIITKRDLRRLF